LLLIIETQVQYQDNPYGICTEKSGIGAGFSVRTLDLPANHNFTDVSYSTVLTLITSWYKHPFEAALPRDSVLPLPSLN
jgi:hypothetical protein